MKLWHALAFPAALLAFAAPATAQVRPQPGPGDPRVQTVQYNADQVVLLQAAVGYQITLEFAPDERIENVALGDSAAWQATPNRRGDYLFIKPMQSGAATNMTVLTDSRLYAFELRAVPAGVGEMAFTVRFRYPAAPSTGDRDAAAEPPHGRYRVTGARAIRPTGIDDDGAKTYIQWAADVPLPAVYAIDSNGKEALVTGNMRDGLFVIDSVASTLVFRFDLQVARAERVAQKERN